ncbi:hypothetical protein [Xanthobacter autotrophicus]|uniref:hypothetical protein n=1 Tax=Xanthobacter autotrophicus TaxID=280 RepID=UPI00372A356C
MSVPFWPSELMQRVLVDGYSEGFGDGRIRQAMDAGPPKVRRRFSAVTRPVRASIKVDFDGIGRLNRFWTEETAGGALPFWFPDQTSDGLPLLTADGVPLLTESGAPLLITSWWLVIFGDEEPVISAESATLFVATFNLNILP